MVAYPRAGISTNVAQSPFLDLLFKYQCIRTQKKQKVFYWSASLPLRHSFTYPPFPRLRHHIIP